MSDDLWFESPEDELSDEEYPEGDEEDEENLTVPCPRCHAEIYEDSVRCPICGSYVTSSTGPWAGRPLWWIALGLLGILAVILVLGLTYW